MADEPDDDGPLDPSRRNFLIRSAVATTSVAVVTTIGSGTANAAEKAAASAPDASTVPITLKVNGVERSLYSRAKGTDDAVKALAAGKTKLVAGASTTLCRRRTDRCCRSSHSRISSSDFV